MGLVNTVRRKCCQWESVASSNVANIQLGIEIGGGYGAGRIGLVYYSAKGKLRWRQNADIAVRRATDTDARTAVTFCLVACKQGELRRKDILLCHLRA